MSTVRSADQRVQCRVLYTTLHCTAFVRKRLTHRVEHRKWRVDYSVMDAAGNAADAISREVILEELSLEDYAKFLKLEPTKCAPCEKQAVDCQRDCRADIDAAASTAATDAANAERQKAEAAERRHRAECTAAVNAARSDTSRCPTVSAHRYLYLHNFACTT
jgi:hypothetical protein